MEVNKSFVPTSVILSV